MESGQVRRIVLLLRLSQREIHRLRRGERVVGQSGVADHKQYVLQGFDRCETFDVRELARSPDHLLEQLRRLQIGLGVCSVLPYVLGRLHLKYLGDFGCRCSGILSVRGSDCGSTFRSSV